MSINRLITGPARMEVDSLNKLVKWRRADVGHHTVKVEARNRAGRDTISWEIEVPPGYFAKLNPMHKNLFFKPAPVLITGRVEFYAKEGSAIKQLLQDIVPVSVYIRKGASGSVIFQVC